MSQVKIDMLNTKQTKISTWLTFDLARTLTFHIFFFSPGNGIVGCDPEEVVANSGRRLLRGPWSKIVKIASSLKSLEKEFWEISRELSPCYSLVILAFVRWKNGEKMGTPHGCPVVRTTQQGVGDPLPAREFAGTSWRLLCQQRWMPSPQRWCTPFRPGCWVGALHGIRQLPRKYSYVHATSHKIDWIYYWHDTVDGRNPAPVEVGSFSHYLQGFIHPRWLFRSSSINR